MTINVELLDKVLATIEANPAEWKQNVYRCETGMCFAGWACQLAGGEWLNPADENWPDALVAEPDDQPDRVFHFKGRLGVTACARAERVLGLTNEQADDLFESRNTIEDLRDIVAYLKAGAS